MSSTDVLSVKASLSLQQKLERLYEMRTGDERPTQNFRPPYLALLHKLGDPHLRLPPCIHVAGTNGKGSTIAFMRAMLEAAGYKVHVYTSPHLLRFNERIVLAGQNIQDEVLERYIDEALAANDGAPLTFFEISTAIAFLAFSQTAADIVLLETGMGGRLDCTNVIEPPMASVITPVSLDHMEFLGTTVQDIAKEKAGIIKSGSKCIIAPQDPAVRAVLINAAERQNCETYPHDTNWKESHDDTKMHFSFDAMTRSFPHPVLTGVHQFSNAATAIMTIKTLNGFTVSDETIAAGLQNAKWPGRLERIASGALFNMLPEGWELWYDGGHNEAAARVLAEQAALWARQDSKPLHIILGMKRTKDPQRFITPFLPYAASLSVTKLPQDHDETGYNLVLESLNRASKSYIHHYRKAEDYVRTVCNAAEGRILVTGSLYLSSVLE